MKPCVSVVIPCYNVAPYLEDCVKSVLSQAEVETEIICVDNGSEDDTPEILARLSRDYGVIALRETAPGAGNARNRGLEVCEGAWVQFLDADDLLLAGKIASQLDAAKDQTDIVLSDFYQQEISGRQNLVKCADDPWVGLMVSRAGKTSSTLLRTQAVRQAGGWDRGLRSSQEYNLLFRMMQKTEGVVVLHQPLTVIRRRPGQISSRQTEVERALRRLDLRKRIAQFLKRERPGFWRDHEALFLQYMLTDIKTVAWKKREQAEALFAELIPPGFLPEPSWAFSRRYIWVYRRFGFSGAERLRRLLLHPYML